MDKQQKEITDAIKKINSLSDQLKLKDTQITNLERVIDGNHKVIREFELKFKDLDPQKNHPPQQHTNDNRKQDDEKN